MATIAAPAWACPNCGAGAGTATERPVWLLVGCLLMVPVVVAGGAAAVLVRAARRTTAQL